MKGFTKVMTYFDLSSQQAVLSICKKVREHLPFPFSIYYDKLTIKYFIKMTLK